MYFGLWSCLQFWLFSFERYNGILGNYYTNNKCIEVQLMKKFLRDRQVMSLECPEIFKEQLTPLTEKLVRDSHVDNVVLDFSNILKILQLNDGVIDVTNTLWHSVDHFTFGSPHVIERFDYADLQYIIEVYRLFFPDVSVEDIPHLYGKYASIECCGERYGSQFSRLNRCSHIVAKWADRYDSIVTLLDSDIRPGIVLYYIKQTVWINQRKYTFCFARVNWFQYHPNRFLCGSLKFGVLIYLNNLVLLRFCRFSEFQENLLLGMATFNAKKCFFLYC